jgi:hypothetical protein
MKAAAGFRIQDSGKGREKQWSGKDRILYKKDIFSGIIIMSQAEPYKAEGDGG